MRRSFFALFILLLGCTCTQKITYNSPNTLKKITSSVVKINIEYVVQDKVTLATVQKAYAATGFSILATDVVSFILTNQHVCDMRQEANYILTTQSGLKMRAIFIRSDPFADICLLKVYGVIPALKLSKQNASQGDRIVTIGNPDGVFPVMVDGIISGYHNTHMKHGPDEDGDFEVHFRAQVMSAPIYPGSSGSPVMSMNNEVVGIVFAVRADKEHISFIVPINEVWRFLDIEEYVHMN